MIICLVRSMPFNDQTTEHQQHVTKHLSTQTAHKQLSLQQKQVRESNQNIQTGEGITDTIRTQDFHHASPALLAETLIKQTNNESKNSRKTRKLLAHNNIDNSGASFPIQLNENSKPTVGVEEKEESIQRKKYVKNNSIKKYSFENELPVRDPGPYSPAGASIDNFHSGSKANVTNNDTPLRSQVQELLIRHQEDLKLIHEADINLKLPKPITAMANLVKPHSKTSNSLQQPRLVPHPSEIPGRLQPDVVPVKHIEDSNIKNRGSSERGLISSSEVEEAPPTLHFAETPDDLNEGHHTQNVNPVDPFNFMSTIQRKFVLSSNSSPNVAQLDINYNPSAIEPSSKCVGTAINLSQQGSGDMVLSEGPLSTSFASSRPDHEGNNMYHPEKERENDKHGIEFYRNDDIITNTNEKCEKKSEQGNKKGKSDHERQKFKIKSNNESLPAEKESFREDQKGRLKTESLNNMSVSKQYKDSAIEGDF